jgi:hypothetical protein
LPWLKPASKDKNGVTHACTHIQGPNVISEWEEDRHCRQRGKDVDESSGSLERSSISRFVSNSTGRPGWPPTRFATAANGACSWR